MTVTAIAIQPTNAVTRYMKAVHSKQPSAQNSPECFSSQISSTNNPPTLQSLPTEVDPEGLKEGCGFSGRIGKIFFYFKCIFTNDSPSKREANKRQEIEDYFKLHKALKNIEIHIEKPKKNSLIEKKKAELTKQKKQIVEDLKFDSNKQSRLRYLVFNVRDNELKLNNMNTYKLILNKQDPQIARVDIEIEIENFRKKIKLFKDEIRFLLGELNSLGKEIYELDQEIEQLNTCSSVAISPDRMDNIQVDINSKEFEQLLELQLSVLFPNAKEINFKKNSDGQLLVKIKNNNGRETAMLLSDSEIIRPI